MTRKRIRTPEQVDAIKAQIIALVAESPKTAAEISKAVGINGNSLGHYFTVLLRAGEVSRHQYRKGYYRYHIRDTAPTTSYRVQIAPPPKPEAMQYAVPVKKVVVRPFSLAGENGTSAEVTLPAAPWEVAA